MNLQIAKNFLTDENIAITAGTLAALDALHEDKYLKIFDEKIRKTRPHSESEAIEAAERALEHFSYACPMGNAYGMRMNISVLVNSMNFLEMQEKSVLALDACKELDSISE